MGTNNKSESGCSGAGLAKRTVENISQNRRILAQKHKNTPLPFCRMNIFWLMGLSSC